MMTMTPRQGQILAALIHELRETWEIPGILPILKQVADRADAFDIALAALHAAQDEKNRTPAVIALPGPHWTRGKALGEATSSTYARCPVIGHTSYAAHNCGACRWDAIESATEPAHQADRTPVVPTARVRQILASHSTADGRNER